MKLNYDIGTKYSSSFDDVFTKLEKTIKRVHGHAGAIGTSEDMPQQRDTRNDALVVRRDHMEYREGLEIQAREVKTSPLRPAQSVHKAPRVRGHASDFEVELVLSMSLKFDEGQKVPASKRAANDIIWRAYATTKSFGAIISCVVATQSVVRRWLAVKKFQQEKRVKVTSATKIKAAWRTYHHRSEYKLSVKNLTICQSLVRCYLARKRVEGMRHELLLALATEKQVKESTMATKISSTWRRYSSKMLYERVVKDLIVVQSLARVNAARKKVEKMRYERNVAAATVIQAKWRAILATNHFVDVQSKVILLQCFVRKTVALIKLEQLKEEKRIIKAQMATKISSAWKMSQCQTAYKCTVRCVVVWQCIVRRFLAVRTLATLRHERDIAAATRIATEVRSFVVRKHFVRLKSSTMLLQSLVRRYAASRLLDLLKEERRRLVAESATKISSVWRSHYVRTGYIIVLKGAY
eukprot:CCRYP_012969-RA/>CCRYP_012969-RA protein AED:0.02 eAED:0.02 QI:209/1/1/1/1/1/4/766/466